MHAPTDCLAKLRRGVFGHGNDQVTTGAQRGKDLVDERRRPG
jgi:hypothetical protein